MRHNGYERVLAHIRTFARHIRSGNNHQPVVGVVDIDIVCNERLVGYRLHYGVSARYYVHRAVAIRNVGFYVTVSLCYFCQRNERVKAGKRTRGALQAFNIVRKYAFDFFKNRNFDLFYLFAAR